MAATKRKARKIHRVVGASEEVARAVANGVKAFDRITLGIKNIHFLVHVHAMHDCGKTNVTMDAVERCLLDRLEPLNKKEQI